ncbi:beta-mannanase [Paenibacillus qinlingensis]|uniref:Uncharacterized protein n=1 Tax=Paenibacillus qinlingensis TaxID=1837343 RepID=A0ABU1NNQ2_9BACL|nr:beta-mannanase [Paenibacillus qinlingensis]MDR6549106.1 hypothetical protein [Paenibacillus qinlingensis]
MNAMFQVESSFFLGVNYWASHAGTAMWSDWRPEQVDRDLQNLAAAGVEILRVFPLWPDFQPINTLYTGRGKRHGHRFGEDRLPDTAAGQAGVSEIMMDRFRVFTAIAERHGLKLIVGLLAGWMSGRLFVPPALQGKPILTDPDAIRWQVRFVRYFISEMKHESTIVAWDLGNECNEMGEVASQEEAWLWTSSIANAIKAADSSRPLVSGMHSLLPAGKWTMQDQGELTDILTTHPYPFWTPYMDFDPLDTIRPTIHATAESLFYGQIGGKPSFAEEMGTMGPMVCSEETAAAFARTSMLSQWAHGLDGLLWWCANDQTKLQHAPYDWVACEGELGLLTEEGRVKPALQEMGKLKKAIESLPTPKLPPRITEAVCIVNTSQDHWAAALGSFMLAKQAGFDLAYQFEDQPLKQADIYLLASLSGVLGIPKQRWEELLRRVADGATLYMSTDDGYTLNFAELTGLTVVNRQRRAEPVELTLAAESGNVQMSIPASFCLTFRNDRAEVLAEESDGNPVLTKAFYGKGTVYFLSVPVELAMVQGKGTSFRPEENPFWKLYEKVSAEIRSGSRVMRAETPNWGITEHPIDERTRVAVIINYSPVVSEESVSLADGWKVAECWYGQNPSITGYIAQCSLPANDGMIILLKKEK